MRYRMKNTRFATLSYIFKSLFGTLIEYEPPIRQRIRIYTQQSMCTRYTEPSSSIGTKTSNILSTLR